FTLVGPSDMKSLDLIQKLTGNQIEKAEIEGLPEAAIGDPSDRGGRGRRAEELKQEHSKRLSEKKKRFVKRDAERPTASMEPIEQAESPAPQERAERKPRGEPRRDERAEAPKREQERRPQREERGDQVQGFGDNLPAFLRKK